MKELVDSSALGWERVQCHKMEVEKCLSWKCLVNPVDSVFFDGDHFGHSIPLLQSETTLPQTLYLLLFIYSFVLYFFRIRNTGCCADMWNCSDMWNLQTSLRFIWDIQQYCLTEIHWVSVWWVLKWWFPNSDMSSLFNNFKNGKLNVCLIILQIFTHNWSNMYVPRLHSLGNPCKQNPGLGISSALYVVHFPLFLWVLYIQWSYIILTPFSDHLIFVTMEVYKKKSDCMHYS